MQAPSAPRALKPSTIAEIGAAKDKQLQSTGTTGLQQRLVSLKIHPPPTIETAVITAAASVANDLSKVQPVQQNPQPIAAPTTPAVVAVPKPIEPPNVGLQAFLQRRRFAGTGADNQHVVVPASPAVPAVTTVAAAVSSAPAVVVAARTPPVAVAATPCEQPAATAPWQQAAPIAANTAQRLLVQHIDPDDTTIIWAIRAENEAACMQLLADSNTPGGLAASSSHPAPIAVGALVAVPFDELYYRAVVLKDDSPLNEIACRLLDYGNELFVGLEHVRVPLPCMLSLPAFAFRLRLRRKRTPFIGETLHVQLLDEVAKGIHGAEEAPSAASAAAVPAADVPASRQQQQHQSSSAVDAKASTVTTMSLLPATAPIVSACVAAETPAPGTQPEALPRLRRFRQSDLKIEPMPLDGPVKLTCLDTSDLSLGLITAAVFNTERLRYAMEVLPQRIAAYCNGPLAQMFTPQPGELCLAVYSEDGAWYRAACLETDEATGVLQVLFVDYGNVTQVKLADVRNISAELMADPCLAVGCLIDGEFERETPVVKILLDSGT